MTMPPAVYLRVLILACVITSIAITANADTVIPESLSILNLSPTTHVAKAAPVKFLHSQHIMRLSDPFDSAYKSCTKCHHTFNTTTDTRTDLAVIQRCESCHLYLQETNDFKQAFHDLCLRCHYLEHKLEKSKPPVSCKSCHVPVAAKASTTLSAGCGFEK